MEWQWKIVEKPKMVYDFRKFHSSVLKPIKTYVHALLAVIKQIPTIAQPHDFTLFVISIITIQRERGGEGGKDRGSRIVWFCDEFYFI